MPGEEKLIRLGFIGCGRVAVERHLPALRRLTGVHLAAVADIEATRAFRLGVSAGAELRFADYRELLSRPDIDAVAVLTPTGSHGEIGLAALDAGKHVLMEKPLALTRDECDRLVARSASSPLKVVVCFNLRWHRLVRRARAFVRTGALGRIHAVHSTYTHFRSGLDAPDWHRSPKQGGGVAFNEGVHHFDLWRYLLGMDVEQVFALSAPSDHYEDETSAVVARLEGGAVATATLALRTAPNSEVEIFGDSGRLQVSLYRFDGLRFFPSSGYPGSVPDRLRHGAASITALAGSLPVLRRGGDFCATFDGIWEHFVECIRHGTPSECTPEDGRRAVQIALAAVESARTGRAVQAGAGNPRSREDR